VRRFAAGGLPKDSLYSATSRPPALNVEIPVKTICGASKKTLALMPCASAALAFMVLICSPSRAQTELPPVTVEGEKIPYVPASTISQDIAAAPASTTVLTSQDLERQSISTYGDIFRSVPGVFVNDYGQGTVAYEIKMRGFISAHGSDIAFFLDGVPLNISGSSHKNGYMDLSTLIPETISRVDIVRGPFSVTAGNHAVAGSVNIHTDLAVPSLVKVDIDNFGRTRVLPMLSRDVGDGNLLMAADVAKGSGYADNSNLDRENLLARYSLPIGEGKLSARLQYYDAKADAPGYLNLARIESGLIAADSSLSKGNGDQKRQKDVVLNYRSNDEEGHSGWGSGWTATTYIVADTRWRWFNYNIDTPIGTNPPLEMEHDDTNQFGLDVRKATMLNESTQLMLGTQLNNEKVDGLVYDFTDYQRQLLAKDWALQRTLTTRSFSVFEDLQWNPVHSLKVQTGLRWDHIDLKSQLGALDNLYNASGGNSFDTIKTQLSPKLGFAWTLLEAPSPLDIFANAARGLKTPYAFAAGQVADKKISSLDSYELGVRGGDQRANWRSSVWRTVQNSEALFDGGGNYLSTQKTNRNGFDLDGHVALTADIRLSANFSRVYARVANSAKDHIITVPDWTAGVGIDGTLPTSVGKVEWSLFDTIIGPQPLYVDNSKKTHSFDRVTARGEIAPYGWKGTKFALSTTYYSRQFDEMQFDAGNGEFGTAPKPRWTMLFSAQYAF
jgi:outer membrane receptor protein involved in Fe transport